MSFEVTFDFGFEATFDFGFVGELVVSDGWGGVPMLHWRAQDARGYVDAGAIPLEEAIPQLERVLETAKMVLHKDSQEEADG